MDIADELQKLQQLRQSGAISEDEFAQAKAKLLSPAPSGLGAVFGGAATEQQARQWAMVLHISQLAGFVVPLAGLLAPILIWQLKKADVPGLDEHGKIVANWIVSEILYAVGCIVLSFLVIGVPLLLILMVLGIVFPIMGAVKANNGETWKYPMSISFF